MMPRRMSSSEGCSTICVMASVLAGLSVVVLSVVAVSSALEQPIRPSVLMAMLHKLRRIVEAMVIISLAHRLESAGQPNDSNISPVMSVL